MLPLDGWRLETELYSLASNNTSSPRQGTPRPRLSDSPLPRNLLNSSKQKYLF